MAERRPPGFNVDLGFYDSPQVNSIPRRIRAAAIGVWTLCGAFSANKLQDGYVGAETLKQLGCTPAIRAALMSTTDANGDPDPLWEDAHSGGIQFTRWTKWQRTRAEVKAYRDAEATRKREKRKANRDNVTSDNTEMSGRTSVGQSQPVRPDHRDPKTKTETETKTETFQGSPRERASQPVAAAVPPRTPTPPSKFCENHPNGTTRNCGPCARARQIHDEWLAVEDQLEQDRADARHAERERLAALAQRCRECSGTGRRWIDDDTTAICHHDELMAEIDAGLHDTHDDRRRA